MFARDPDSRLGLVTLLLLLLVSAGARGVAAADPPPTERARLVLLLILDQGRADYLVRFRPLFKHGFDRLLRESVVFTQAFHDHALTKTAPGHAVLVTGTHPAKNGIVSNDWLDRESGRVVEADEDSRYREDRSPHRLLVPTLGDTLKERWPDAKVYGISAKSRSAVLAAGRRADGAFWLDDTSSDVLSSDYYPSARPEWLVDFRQRAFPDRFFGTVWELLPEVIEAIPRYSLATVARGLVHSRHPHPIGRETAAPDEYYYEKFLEETPFTDRYLLELAERLIAEEGMGRDASPDFLSISFSGLDYVGHAYGPDSPEVLDTLLRLDRVLGELLAFVDREVGLEHTLISLSSDHGVAPVPELATERGFQARRFGLAEVNCIQTLSRKLSERFGEAEWFAGDFVFDRQVVHRKGLSDSQIETDAAQLVRGCPGVVNVWTRSELTATESSQDDPVMRLYRNSFHPARSPDLLLQLENWAIGRSDNATTHGSPYRYDAHVPWLVRLRSPRPRVIDTRVSTADVAPTLAHVLGVEMTGNLDGQSRSSLLFEAPDVGPVDP